MRKTIFQFDGFELFVEPAQSVEPSHQVIGVSPATDEAVSLLQALTGARHVLEIAGHAEGRIGAIAQHDEHADTWMVNLIDIIAAIRRASPDIIQLGIEGMTE